MLGSAEDFVEDEVHVAKRRNIGQVSAAGRRGRGVIGDLCGGGEGAGEREGAASAGGEAGREPERSLFGLDFGFTPEVLYMEVLYMEVLYIEVYIWKCIYGSLYIEVYIWVYMEAYILCMEVQIWICAFSVSRG